MVQGPALCAARSSVALLGCAESQPVLLKFAHLCTSLLTGDCQEIGGQKNLGLVRSWAVLITSYIKLPSKKSIAFIPGCTSSL
jgi:hypothetical protein